MKLNPLATLFAGLAFAAVLPLTAFAATNTSAKERLPNSSAMMVKTGMIAKSGSEVVYVDVAVLQVTTAENRVKSDADELKAATWATWRDITYKIDISSAHQQCGGHSYDNASVSPANGTSTRAMGSYASAPAVGYSPVDLAKLTKPDRAAINFMS